MDDKLLMGPGTKRAGIITTLVVMYPIRYNSLCSLHSASVSNQHRAAKPELKCAWGDAGSNFVETLLA